MLPVIPKPEISRSQKSAALAVAGFVDLIQVVIFPVFGPGVFSWAQDALDFMTAMILIAICGFKWQFILAFMLELTPVMDLFPTWTAVVVVLPVRGEGPMKVSPRVNVERVDRRRGEMVDGEAIVVPPVQVPRTRG